MANRRSTGQVSASGGRSEQGERGEQGEQGERYREIKQQLVARHEALSAEVRKEVVHAEDERAERVEQSMGERMEAIDQRVVDRFRKLERADIERHTEELAEIEEALERLQDGRYGQCADCGASIGAQRLEVQPAAARCIDCQNRREEAGRKA